MGRDIQEKHLNRQRESGLAERVVEKAKEAEARARRASELADEEAIRARESAAKLYKAMMELAQEAKRKARGGQVAALKAKREAKLVARIVKQANKAEGRATSRYRMTTVEKINVKAALDKTAVQAKGDSAKEAEWASSELLEGTVNILLLQPPDARQMDSLMAGLRSVQNLRIVLVAGSMEEPVRVVVLAEQRVPLIDVLGRIPIVDQVTRSGREIQLSLKK